MTYLAPLLLLLLFSMVCLTAPDGLSVWVEKNSVVSVFKPVQDDCFKGSKSKVTLSNGSSLCVQENRQDVVKKIDATK